LKRTRKIAISQRVLTSKDLIRIAGVLGKQELPSKKEFELSMSSRKFEVGFDDGTEVESESPEVFDDEWLTSSSRPMAVSMYYRDLKLKREISVRLHHGDRYHTNEATVSGEDAEWVNATFQELKDDFGKVKPQVSWVLRHPRLLLNLIALGIGSLGMLIMSLFMELVFRIVGPPHVPAWPWLATLRSPSLQPYFYVGGWIFRWIAGFTWGAFTVNRWLLEMWPSVEFAFGSPHLQTENIRRQRLNSVLTLVVLPVVITLVYDWIKAH
jgi:hypothetical protein